jgi:hypothetical protein
VPRRLQAGGRTFSSEQSFLDALDVRALKKVGIAVSLILPAAWLLQI